MIYSYSLINCFHEVCPRQAYERWWLKVKAPYTPEQYNGITLHKATERRMLHDVPLPPELTQIEHLCKALEGRGIPQLEVKMATARDCTATGFWDGDAYLRGVLDVALYNADNTQVFIGDWKTGKKREDGVPLQLMIFAAFTFAYDEPLKQVTAVNMYTRDGTMGKVHTWNRSELPELWRHILPLIHEIEQAEFDQKWPERQGPLCAWCPVFHCQHNRNPQKGAA